MKRVCKKRVDLPPLNNTYRPIRTLDDQVIDESRVSAPRDTFTSRVQPLLLPQPEWPPSYEALKNKHGWLMPRPENLPAVKKFNIYTRQPGLREKGKLLPLSRNPLAEHTCTCIPLPEIHPAFEAKVPAKKVVYAPPPACSAPLSKNEVFERKAKRITRMTTSGARRRANLVAVQRRAMDSMMMKVSRENIAKLTDPRAETNESHLAMDVRQKLREEMVRRLKGKARLRMGTLKLNITIDSLLSLDEPPDDQMPESQIPDTITEASDEDEQTWLLPGDFLLDSDTTSVLETTLTDYSDKEEVNKDDREEIWSGRNIQIKEELAEVSKEESDDEEDLTEFESASLSVKAKSRGMSVNEQVIENIELLEQGLLPSLTDLQVSEK